MIHEIIDNKQKRTSLNKKNNKKQNTNNINNNRRKTQPIHNNYINNNIILNIENNHNKKIKRKSRLNHKMDSKRSFPKNNKQKEEILSSIENKNIQPYNRIKKNSIKKNSLTSTSINKITNSKKSQSLIYTDNELNEFKYKKALKHDKRTYCQYYMSLLREKHLIIFAFYIKEKDYNLQIIKILFFFFFFDVYFIVNALFFNDNTMHKIFIDNGNYNFIYQIPQILYSTLISSLITSFIKFFALTESNVIKIKNKKSITNIDIDNCYGAILVKFVLFFIFAFLFLLLFTYYFICFCGIYINTQIHLIKDTLISFSTSLVTTFILNLLPGFFRISALNGKNKKCTYQISKILQIL